MQNKNSIMATFFIGTIGAMIILIGMIFLGYCIFYEIKHKKRIYKEPKIVAGVCIIIGIIMVALSCLYFSKYIM